MRNDYSGSRSDPVKLFRIPPDRQHSLFSSEWIQRLWTYLVVGIHHGCVATRAELRIELEELLVAEVKEIGTSAVDPDPWDPYIVGSPYSDLSFICSDPDPFLPWKNLIFVSISTKKKDLDPNPQVSGSDPQIRIPIKLSRIRNTAGNESKTSLAGPGTLRCHTVKPGSILTQTWIQI